MILKPHHGDALAGLLERDPIMSSGVSGLIARLGDRAKVHVDDQRRPSAVIAWGPRRTARFFAASVDDAARFMSTFRGDGRPLAIGGLSPDVAAAVSAVIECRQRQLFDLLVLDADSTLPMATDHPTTPLRMDEARLVAESWPHARSVDEAEEYVRAMIALGPSVAVREERGGPVSFAAVADHGSMGFMYTLPSHRGRGLARSVTVALARAVRERGCIPNAWVAPDNDASRLLLEGVGFRRHRTCHWLSCFHDDEALDRA